jgi:hypothetical protein
MKELQEVFGSEVGVVYLVYKGLTEREREALLAPVANVADDDKEFYPRPAKDLHFYLDKNKQSLAETKRKIARRKKFRELRLQETQQAIDDVDAVREVCGLVFAKDEMLEVDLAALSPAARYKLMGWVSKGILHLTEQPAEEAPPQEEPEPKAEAEAAPEAKPKKRGRPPKAK